MRKLFRSLLAGTVLSILCAGVSYAGYWQNDGTHYWYQITQNACYKSGVYNVDGGFYGFDSNGYMLTGWQQGPNGAWYYFTPSGAAQIGLYEENGKKYYFDPASGVMSRNAFVEADQKLYYCGEDGVIKTNEFFTLTNQDGETYCYQAKEDGHVRRNESTTDTNGNEWKFLENGITMYKSYSSTTEGYDDGWRYYLGFTDEQSNQVKDDLWVKNLYEHRATLDPREEYIKQKKSSYASEYKALLWEKLKESRRQIKIGTWEYHVKRDLAACGVSDNEIEQYIALVKNGIYVSEEYDFVVADSYKP